MARSRTSPPSTPNRAARRVPRLPLVVAAATLSLGAVALSATTAGAFGHHGHHGPHAHHSFLASLAGTTSIGTTVPTNGDVNPYGIVTVPRSEGLLVRGDTLISNFNNVTNAQGTGTTIVEIAPGGALTLFAQLSPTLAGCPGGVGLTTALAILPHGDVVVGSLPTESGGPLAGCLIVLDAHGNVLTTWADGNLNGPWDLTSTSWGDFSELFVTNVLNGTVAAAGAQVDEGTVVRLDVISRPHRTPRVVSETVIASGFPEELNGPALVLGPTGVALSGDTLYVADTVGNRIAAIPHATWRHDTFAVPAGLTVSAGGSLNAPLGLMTAPNGNVIAANGADGNAVEVSPFGQQVDTVQLDPLNAGGDLFGLTLSPSGHGILFVDDGDNTLKLLGH
jgi:hypothetical protein